MKPSTVLRTTAALAALVAAAPSQGVVGSRLPKATLEGFTNIGAESLADLGGRAILLEFFAYW